MKKRVAILGATGSIGKSALDILRKKRDLFQPVLFTANNNASELQILKKEFPAALLALGKKEILDAIAKCDADITVNGISGAAGLEPSLAVINAGSDLALANKETVVMSGTHLLSLAKEKNVKIIPVDSEHSAIFLLIMAHGRENVSEIILTASGGPFKNYSLRKLKTVTPREALSHPTWNMGQKITIDSASLANKGLEVIEASYLFNFPPEKIKVTIHQQSIVHSMIRLNNGAVYAQMSQPDMRLPISDALSWPETDFSPWGSLDFTSLSLSFEKPDLEKFPMLYLAYEALKTGAPMPTVYNAANEIAVKAFLEGDIGFLEISALVGYVMEKSLPLEKKPWNLETILTVDRKARELAEDFIRLGRQ